jgi:hypothetical protein
MAKITAHVKNDYKLIHSSGNNGPPCALYAVMLHKTNVVLNK